MTSRNGTAPDPAETGELAPAAHEDYDPWEDHGERWLATPRPPLGRQTDTDEMEAA